MKAVSYCLALLKRRLRSRAELEQAMTRRGIDPAERTAALDELEDHGLIDDLQFALAWIHTRDRLAPRGVPLLRAELLQKGVSKEVIEEALARRQQENQQEARDDLELARQLVEGKRRLYSRLDKETRERRLVGLLSRRGFSYEVIRRILDS